MRRIGVFKEYKNMKRDGIVFGFSFWPWEDLGEKNVCCLTFCLFTIGFSIGISFSKKEE